MLHLTFIDGAVETAVVASSHCFRITGGTIHGQHGGPLAIFDSEGWNHGPLRFAGIRFAGESRLVWGIMRDPHPSKDGQTSLALDGRILLANSRPFARYDPRRDMWDALLRPRSWHAVRIVSTDWLEKFPQAAMEYLPTAR
jgi:hypothetical protein